MRLAGVVVAVDRDQHLGLDLAEAVDDALHAEIGRAGGPHRAEAGGGEHGDDRLGHVGELRGDAVAGPDAAGGERVAHARAPGPSPTTPQKRQTSRQKASRSSTDQRHSAS